MTIKRFLVRVVLALFVVTAIGGGICVYLGISTSLHAENTLHAILSTIKNVDHFVAVERRWPKSWEELGPPQEESQDAETWRIEAARRQKYMRIDFNADLSEIASQTPEQFKAIYPTGAYYPYTHYGFLPTLIETATQVTKGESGIEAVLDTDTKANDVE